MTAEQFTVLSIWVKMEAEKAVFLARHGESDGYMNVRKREMLLSAVDQAENWARAALVTP